MHWWKSLTAVCSKPCTSHPGLIGDLRVANSPSLLPVPPPVPKGTLPLALFPWEKMAREGGLEVVVPNSALWKWVWLFLRMRRWRFLLKKAPYRCFNKAKILLGWWQTCFPQVKNDGKDLRILNWKILCDTKQRRTSFATTVDTESLEAKPKLQIKWINHVMSRAEKYQEPDPIGNSVPRCKFIPKMPLKTLTFIFENHQLNKRDSIKKNAIRNIYIFSILNYLGYGW